MKLINYIMLSTALLLIGLSLLQDIYIALFFNAIALLIIISQIISIVKLKRLERNLVSLEEYDRVYGEWNTVYSELAFSKAENEELLSKIEKLENDLIPFSEDIKQCPVCGKDMNKRKVYWTCECGKRLKRKVE